MGCSQLGIIRKVSIFVMIYIYAFIQVIYCTVLIMTLDMLLLHMYGSRSRNQSAVVM